MTDHLKTESTYSVTVSAHVADYTLDCWAADEDAPEGITVGSCRRALWKATLTQAQYDEFLAQAAQQVDMWNHQACYDNDDRADKARWNRALATLKKVKANG